MGVKVTFEPTTKTIKFKSGVTSVDFRDDVFSDGKEDWLASADLRKYKFPVRSIGGNEVTGGKVIEPTFFLRYGWQMEPDDANHTVTVYGNVFHDDGISPVKVQEGYSIVVNMSTTISPDTGNPLVVQRASEDTTYAGVVTVDVTATNDYAESTEYPAGTPSYPVNNLVDAISIANARGFTHFNILESMEVNTGSDFTGVEFYGQSITKTLLTIESSADTTKSEFYEAAITGTLDGENKLNNCLLQTLNFVNGIVSDCLLGNYTITLGGSTDAYFLNCWSVVSGEDTPIIDMGGAGQDLGLRNYNGVLKITNLDWAANTIAMDLNSAKIILDSTITAGTVVCRGVGALVDTSGNPIPSGTWNGGVTIVNTAIDTLSIARQVWEEDTADHTTITTFGGAIGFTKKVVGWLRSLL
jgi:hypothetical protein